MAATIRARRLAQELRRIASYRIPATFLSRLTIRSSGTFGVLAGVLLTIGGQPRFSGPGYAVLRGLPGSPFSWAGVAFLAGVAILLGSAFGPRGGVVAWRIKAYGLILISAWCTAFSAGVIGAAVLSPFVGLIGALAFAYITVATAIVVWVDEGEVELRA